MDKDKKKSVILGNFDGVHLGHRAVIVYGVEQAKKRGISSVVYTFCPYINNVEQIMSFDEKYELIKELGIDEIYSVNPFDGVKDKTPEQFVCDVLKNTLNAQCVTVGYNYTFGKQGKANANDLASLCKKYDIECFILDEIKDVSSTEIRKCLKNGDIQRANELLGHDYSVYGTVKHGKGLGRQLGFRTANITTDIPIILKTGVYGGYTLIDGNRYDIMCNIGNAPTFHDDTYIPEVHIMDFDMDIYNKKLRVYITKKLRNIVKFNSPQELISQLEKDKKLFLKK